MSVIAFCSHSLLFLLQAILVFVPDFKSAEALGPYHVIKARVYVDASGLQKWKYVTGKPEREFQHEMADTFYEISRIMKSLERYNLYIQVQIESLNSIGKNILPVNHNGTIYGNNSVESFWNWVSPTFSRSPYDIALLWTGHNLVKDGNYSDESTLGYANIGGACYARGVGVMEISGTYTDVIIAAHEIGHILGAHHDGSTQSASCAAKQGFVMESHIAIETPNHFYYSPCSVHAFINVIHRLNNASKNCFYDGTFLPISAPKYGKMVTPDNLCKRRFGAASDVARLAYNRYGDDVCVKLECVIKTEGLMYFWNYMETPPGLNCGVNKHCDQGRCVQAPYGNLVKSDTCPFGDQPKLAEGYTCDKIPIGSCHHYKKTCCETCKNPGVGLTATADQWCQHYIGQHSSMARRAYTNGYGDLLCSKLACITRVEGHHFLWHENMTPDGMKCGQNKVCQKGKCVLSPYGSPTMSDDCPYGDQPYLAGSYQTTCREITAKVGCSSWRNICCGTCRRF